MQTKKNHDFIIRIMPDRKDEIVGMVRGYVDELIAALFYPVKGDSFNRVDDERCKLLGVSRNEPINWGDIRCSEAKEFADGSFMVTLEEASPGACPTLCEYIRSYMESYGWTVQVQTEW